MDGRPDPPSHAETAEEITAFLDSCRELQTKAAALCQGRHPLPQVTREGIHELRRTILKVRKLLSPATPVTEDSADSEP